MIKRLIPFVLLCFLSFTASAQENRLAVFAKGSLGWINFDDISWTDSDGFKFDLDGTDSQTLEFGIGQDITPNLSVEASIFMTPTVEFEGLLNPSISPVYAELELDTTAFMGDIKLYLTDPEYALRPFIGFGLGFAFIYTSDAYASDGFTTYYQEGADEVNIAYRLGAGCSFTTGGNVDIFASLYYMDFGEVNMGDNWAFAGGPVGTAADGGSFDLTGTVFQVGATIWF